MKNEKQSSDIILETIQEQLPDYFLEKRQLLLSEIKTINIFDYMSDNKFSDESTESTFYIPFICQPLLRNTKKFVSVLSKFLTSDDKIYPQMTYNFFMRKSNVSKHLNYFIFCCFPSLFNFFTSDKYSYYCYNFIVQYSNIESEKKSALTTNSLILTYIIHNFQFRMIFFENFFRDFLNLLKNEQVEPKDIFSSLIDSFSKSLSYLDMYQLKILNELPNIKNLISLLKQIFIKLIETWKYTPQFCTNEFFGSVPDDPCEYSKNAKENKLIEFISNYNIDEDKTNIRKKIYNLFEKEIKNSPYLGQNIIKKALIKKRDILILSDYDTFLFSWIIMQESDELPLNGSNMNRNYSRQEEFSSKKSALRLYFIEFDIENKYSIMNSESNALTPLYFIEKQIEACDQIKKSIILKYSDSNFLNEDKTYGQEFITNQYNLLEKEIINKEHWNSYSNLFIFGQLFTCLNRNELSVTDKNYELNNELDKHQNIKYALSNSISFKNNDQSSPKQKLYYSGFRYLSIMEFSNEKYSDFFAEVKNLSFRNMIKALYLITIISKIIKKTEDGNCKFNIDDNIDWEKFWSKKSL